MPRGFLLPETIDPPDDICIAVHIPNDPRYVEAFFGAYQQLSYWYSWQRDPEKRGRLAGLRWRQSVEETWATYLRYGDLCTMQITVNCNCCQEIPITYTPNPDVGQIPSEIADQIIVLPIDLVDDGITPPTLSFADYESYQAWKCQISTQLADDILETFNRLGGLGVLFASVGAAGISGLLSGSLLASSFVGLLATFLTPVGAVAVVIAAIGGVTLAGLRALHYFGELHAAVDREELICLFYNAHDPTAARAGFIDQLEAAYPAIPWDGDDQPLFQGLIEDLLDYVAPDELFAPLFEILQGYDTSGDFDCSACADEPYTTHFVYGSLVSFNVYTTEVTTQNDTICDSKLDVYFGGTAENLGSPQAAPYVTVEGCEIIDGSYLADCGLAHCWTFYRRTGLTPSQVYWDPGSPPTFPITEVYRVAITNRNRSASDGVPTAAAPLTIQLDTAVV